MQARMHRHASEELGCIREGGSREHVHLAAVGRGEQVVLLRVLLELVDALHDNGHAEAHTHQALMHAGLELSSLAGNRGSEVKDRLAFKQHIAEPPPAVELAAEGVVNAWHLKLRRGGQQAAQQRADHWLLSDIHEHREGAGGSRGGLLHWLHLHRRPLCLHCRCPWLCLLRLHRDLRRLRHLRFHLDSCRVRHLRLHRDPCRLRLDFSGIQAWSTRPAPAPPAPTASAAASALARGPA
mmetsp:Transcript_35806/g.113851  ORF Transcript_35806/g.113851 Transcript_35806/m.113851 type:complete len:239 (-) Transcript_35806:1706-2422(-)